MKTAYKTKNGRTVYAGSGIEPDILLEPYTPSNIAISLAGNFHCFNYANKFVKEHPSILPASEFEITDDIYEDFIHFLKDKDYQYITSSEKNIDALIENAQKEQIDSATLSQIKDLKQRIIEDKKNDIYKFKDEIKLLLLDEIIKRYYYQKGSIEASLKHDKEVKRAIEILKDKNEYNKILGK